MNAPTPASMKKQRDEKRAVPNTRQEKVSSKPKPKSSKSYPEDSANTGRGRQSNKPRPTESAEGQKKQFVRKEHLTQKPLKGHQGLDRLKSSLSRSENGKSGKNNRAPHTDSRRRTNSNKAHFDKIQKTVDQLRTFVDTFELLDISNGSEKALGTSVSKMIIAINELEKEGYHRYFLKIQAVGSDARVIIRVLAKPDVTFQDLVNRRNEIKAIPSNKENN